jgi:Secretion system C-terminal sorting domain
VPKHGTAVAFINYDASGGNDWLISPKVTGIVSGDSLVFWLIKQFSDGPWIPDSLIIKVSTTDSLMASFTNTPLRICIHCLPIGAPEIIWRRYTVPLTPFAGQNIYLAFQHTDVDGHGLILDSVTVFGNPPTGIDPVSNIIPTKFELYQNYPNPFNPVTKIDFDIPKTGFTSLRVYDVTGAVVKTIVSEELGAGKYSMNFDASGLSSGIYYYRLESNGIVKTLKMSLVK